MGSLFSFCGMNEIAEPTSRTRHKGSLQSKVGIFCGDFSEEKGGPERIFISKKVCIKHSQFVSL